MYHAGAQSGERLLESVDTKAAGVGSTEQIGSIEAFLLLLKINWGIGMMSMPFFIYKAGLWLGTGFFVLTMALTVVNNKMPKPALNPTS